MVWKKEFEDQHDRLEKMKVGRTIKAQEILTYFQINLSFTFGNGSFHPSDAEDFIKAMEDMYNERS